MKRVKIGLLFGLCILLFGGCTFSGGAQADKEEKNVVPKTSVLENRTASEPVEPEVEEAYRDYDYVRIATMANARFYLEKGPDDVYRVVAAQALNDYGSKVLKLYEPVGMIYEEAINRFVEESVASGYASDINCTVSVIAESEDSSLLEKQATQMAADIYKSHGIEAVVIAGADL